MRMMKTEKEKSKHVWTVSDLNIASFLWCNGAVFYNQLNHAGDLPGEKTIRTHLAEHYT